MDFALEATLEFSKPLDFLTQTFPSLVATMNSELLRKGVPKEQEGSRIVNWKIIGTKIFLRIEGTTYLRPHDALLRIKNFLAEKFGKEHGIGLRDVLVKEYEIRFKPKRAPKQMVEVKVPWVKEIVQYGKELLIKLQNLDSTCLEDRYVERILKRIDEKILAQYVKGKEETKELIKKSKGRIKNYKIKKDVTEELLKLGWIKNFELAGVWHFLPPMASLIRAIESLIVERIAKPMGFEEIFLPKMVSLETERKKGQLAIPNDMFWICPPVSKDAKEFEEFVDYVEVTQKIPKELLSKKLDFPIGALSYAQCEPFYQIFEKEIVDSETLPLKFFDRFGPTWRYEAGGLKGIERLNEFYRIEFVFLGLPEQVVSIRDEIKDRTLEIVDKIFDVEWKLEKVTPVYLEHAGKVEEEKDELVKTYDLSVLLPFQTPSRPEKELEIASFHVHTNFYTERFKIKEKSGEELWTGCAGLGPTRFAYVFLLRHGFEFEKWPDEIKKRIKKLPKGLKLVSWP